MLVFVSKNASVFTTSSTSSFALYACFSAATNSGTVPLPCDAFQNCISTLVYDIKDEHQSESEHPYGKKKNVILNMLLYHSPTDE